MAFLQDLELPPETPTAAQATPDTQFVAPSLGQPPSQRWEANCKLAVDYVASGAFDRAMVALHRSAFLYLHYTTIWAQIHIHITTSAYDDHSLEL